MLRFYSGSTGAINSKRAIAECLEIALGEEESLDCDLLIIYSSIGHRFQDILDEAHRLSPSAHIAGCTGAGVIGKDGPNESMKALAIMAVKGPRSEFAVASQDRITIPTSFQISAQLARELCDKNPNITMIHFLPSGFDAAEDLVLEGMESVFGPGVPIFGATAGDNMRFVTSFQFDGDRIIERGAVAIGFADPTLEVITQATHGFGTMGEPFEVTRAELNRIYEIEGQPAWKFVCNRAGIPDEMTIFEAGPATWFAEELSFEEQQDYGNTHILRGAFAKGEDGSLLMPVICREGTKFWNAMRDEERMFADLDQMVEDLAERCEGREICAVFHADCVGRGRLSLNQILKDEIVRRMQYPLIQDSDAPWLGLYGFGEFARLGGRNLFHMITTSLFVILRNGA